MKRPPLYLQKRGSGTFYVRISIPKDVRQYFRSTEIKRSLKTADLPSAWGLACRLAQNAQRAFQECRRVADSRNRNQNLHQTILRFMKGGETVEIEVNQPNPQDEMAIAAGIVAELRSSMPATKATVAVARPKLSEVISLYSEEKQRETSWTPKTRHENEAIYRLLMDITGDVEVALIDHGVARHVKQTLLRLPPNVNKDPRYRGKPVNDVLALSPTKTLSVSSLNKYLGRLSSFFEWAERHGYVEKNPFSNLALKKTKRPHEERDPFNDEDLTKLFGTPIFTDTQFLHPHYYWIPLLGLYTGARINELCQLRLADVRQEDGVWVLSIDERDDKRVKTTAGTRLIPLHDELIRLGFIDYVDSLKTEAETRLFPALKKQRDGYSQAVQKWFNARYRVSVGVTQKGKSFHSFRHTVANQLKQKDVDSKKIGAILGHVDSSITTGRYAHPYRPSLLQGVVNQLEFPISPKPFALSCSKRA